jgi:uncharacterized protein YbaR (Trm112 family)
MMSWKKFHCPVCRAPLAVEAANLLCASCKRNYEIVDGIPDLFIGDIQRDFDGDPNRTWRKRIVSQPLKHWRIRRANHHMNGWNEFKRRPL